MKNFLIFKINSALVIISAFVLFSCNDEDSVDAQDRNGVQQVEATVSVVDPNQITSSLSIDGAIVTEGQLPVASTESDQLLWQGLSSLWIRTGQQGEINLSLAYVGSNVEGIYFQIDSAGSYYNIPFSSDEVLATDDSVKLKLTLDAAFEPGSFSGSLYLYDDEGRISSPKILIVKVLALGGSFSEFLVDQWSMVGSINLPDSTFIPAGEDYILSHVLFQNCIGEYGPVPTADNTTRFEFINTTFDNLGNVKISGEKYVKIYNLESSTCDEQVYEEETLIVDLSGIWSYDHESGSINVVMPSENTDSGQEVFSIFVNESEDGIELTYNERSLDFGEVIAHIFRDGDNYWSWRDFFDDGNTKFIFSAK